MSSFEGRSSQMAITIAECDLFTVMEYGESVVPMDETGLAVGGIVHEYVPSVARKATPA